MPSATDASLSSAEDDYISDVEDQQSQSSESMHSFTKTSTTDDTEITNDQIAAKETKSVRNLRYLVLMVLFLAAAALSVVVYMITSQAEENEFHAQYYGVASQVLTSFEEIVGIKLAALGSLGVTFTSYARSHEEKWPLVAMNDFQQRASNARELSGALYIQLLPHVDIENRASYEEFVMKNRGWIEEGLHLQKQLGIGQNQFRSRHLQGETRSETVDFSTGIGNKIFSVGADMNLISDPTPGPYFPFWQASPVLLWNLVNLNLFSFDPYKFGINTAFQTGKMALGNIDIAPPGNSSSPIFGTSTYATLKSFEAGREVDYEGDPMSTVYIPIFDSPNANERKPVAILLATLQWSSYFQGILSPASKNIVVVLGNTCDGKHTYLVSGDIVKYLGPGDRHESGFEKYKVSATLGELVQAKREAKKVSVHDLELYQDTCPYSIDVYPTSEMQDEYKTNMPIIVTTSVGCVFLFTVVMFLVYDRLVERRQAVVMRRAKQTSAIVSSMFPEAVRNRLMADNLIDKDSKDFKSNNKRLKSFLAGHEDDEDAENKPIADLFPATTVLFADISGFTAWSSTREPSQVFVLLQTLYQAFDKIAQRHGVFKVETIGDSYVAVTGLPNPQANHAVRMARFAWECMNKMNELVRELEVSLGPDTAELAMRFGLHSGPVTAGVLKGDRARFQLFGDTVNTAARMESTGIRNKIQVSDTTAAELKNHDKGHWIMEREDAVVAKGKGVLQTYWLVRKSKQDAASSSCRSGSDNGDAQTTLSAVREAEAALQNVNIKKQNRLIDWCVEILESSLRKVIARRYALGLTESNEELNYTPSHGQTCLDEVTEVLTMLEHNPETEEKYSRINATKIEIPALVHKQIREYIAVIASTYNDNPFHNFEHACHVTMSVDKLLKRVVGPDVDVNNHSDLYQYTHGIHSDPLLHFAIVLSAVIHDADHRGVGNVQLCKEQPQMGELYKEKSVAEQNSLDISWDLLMSPEFATLRSYLFTNHAEMMRFRQILVNVVLATDIFDKELNDARKARWARAFGEECHNGDLRATIVVEHIIQASDVSHTMQHWHIYRKWNERLFLELYSAYKAGRMAKDPSEFWYQGEIGFFDNYVIPLARKLKECNVFGVSSDEYLTYATNNRNEWESRGKQVVEALVDKARSEYDESS